MDETQGEEEQDEEEVMKLRGPSPQKQRVKTPMSKVLR
jgi:hypothetical protein